jgi:hypothetical protein
MGIFIAAGIFYSILCLVIALYITGAGMSPERHARVGLKAVFASWIVAVVLLMIVVIFI